MKKFSFIFFILLLTTSCEGIFIARGKIYHFQNGKRIPLDSVQVKVYCNSFELHGDAMSDTSGYYDAGGLTTPMKSLHKIIYSREGYKTDTILCYGVNRYYNLHHIMIPIKMSAVDSIAYYSLNPIDSIDRMFLMGVKVEIRSNGGVYSGANKNPHFTMKIISKHRNKKGWGSYYPNYGDIGKVIYVSDYTNVPNANKVVYMLQVGENFVLISGGPGYMVLARK